ncbi:cytochrome P450 family protein [Alkalicoccobacillus murimartini]|uniref:Cytochrome P450 n=1 Tax=Alkalicoccobacillus murimartini TaxID=171685 RepID=A0ABT9YHR4_9BACI|nr:cytochrome P450 [Alkalicoccobacillus murimartini]MDQ0207411.1 cytochrome P450 [Alkalicoccobacillus murimartini]
MSSSEQVHEKVLGFLSGKSDENPFSLFAQLREFGPVISIPNPMGDPDKNAWMVTKMDEATHVLKSPKLFTVDPSSIEKGSEFRDKIVSDSDDSPDTFFTGKSMLFIDGIDHKRLRMLVSKAFTPKYMEGLRPRIQEIADELIDQVQSKGEMDLVKDYAYPLPINVISEMLGIPKSDRQNLQTWSSAIANGLGWGKQDPAVQKHLKEFGEYTKDLVAKKREHPKDDLISQLIAIEEEGERLDEEELISMITLLIFAGHETTSNLIATGSMMLFDHPEQLEQLKADLDLVPTAVEELLRFNGPSTSVGPRFAKEDLELAGQSIKKGDMLLVLVKSANRDEETFSNSDELDITRDVHRHLAFGFGMHMCLGAPLARVEGDIAFTTLLNRLPNLRLSIPPEEVNWQFSLSSQGLESLPVSF